MKNNFLKLLVLVPVFFLWPTSSQAVEVCASPLTGATIIECVDWGTVTSTDSSITIDDAQLVPFVPAGPKTFFLEWGIVEPNGSYTYINTSSPLSLDSPYFFDATLPALQPLTNYYFTINEAGIFDPLSPQQTVYTSLFTYGFGTTQHVDDPQIDFDYSNNNTSVNVNGNLFLSNGQALLGEQIILQIYEVPPGTTLDQDPPAIGLVTSPIITTGGLGGAYGSGYFQHTFGSITPGAAYYLMIKRGIDQPNLILPIYFEVPLVGQPNPDPNPDPGSNATTTTFDGGIIPCDGVTIPCNFDMIIVLVNNVIDFLIVFIAFPIIAIVVAWAGILLLTSGGSSSAKEKAKTMIGHVVIGLILALLAWGIIKIILVTLGYQGPLLSIFGIN